MRSAFLLAVIFGIILPVEGRTLTVDPAGAGDFTDIQAALDAAADGDRVLVAPGEYLLDAPLDFNRLHDAENPAGPPLKNLTLISQQGNAATILRMSPEPRDADRATVVIFENGEDGSSFLAGFTITGGRGSNPGMAGILRGGGILCFRSSPTLLDLRIEKNIAGGLHLQESSSRVNGCAIELNNDGGVACIGGSSVEMFNCRISNNASGSEGGGIYCDGSRLVLASTEISGNRTCRDCTGGGMECIDSVLEMTSCTLTGNQGSGAGGLSVFSGATATLVNCIIAGNWSTQQGGGIQMRYSSRLSLLSSTFHGNAASVGAPDLSCFDNQFEPEVVNCILQSDRGAGETPCGQPSNNLMDEDPKFRRPGSFDFTRRRTVELEDRFVISVPDFILDAGDYRLQEGSPAIDAGKSLGDSGTDFDGAGRPCGMAWDIGAFEFCARADFRRGDADADGVVDISDAINILEENFLGTFRATCARTLDADDSGQVDITDSIYTLYHLFLGGPAPPPPFPGCGPDATEDALPCASFSGC